MPLREARCIVQTGRGMSAQQQTVAGQGEAAGSVRTRPTSLWRSWLFWVLVLLLGAGAGALLAVLRAGAPAPVSIPSARAAAVARWPAGARPAPDFRLSDQHGAPVSLAALRGRPVIVTFIDPLCRNLCPLEAKILNEAVRKLSPARRPTIVSVSVDPWGDSQRAFRQDAVKWHLDGSWRWGTGTYGELARVWRRYEIGVAVAKKEVAGVTVREISHTEAAYVVDRSGYERALFLYPFRAADVVGALQRLAGAA